MSQGVNLDLDPLRIPPNMAVFIKNISDNININRNTPGYSGQNAKIFSPLEGNQALPMQLPSGNSYCIGFEPCEATNKGYFCLYNSLNNHEVWQIDGNNGNTTLVLESNLLPFVLDPQYFLSEGRMIVELISTTDPVTNEVSNFELLVFTNNRGPQFLIDVNASIATNGYTTSYFTATAAFYSRLELFHLGVKLPLQRIGLNTPVAYTPTVADASLQNMLINADWQFRIRTWDVWGRPSDWGIISDTFIVLIGSGCIASSNGQPRCVNINFDAGNPTIKFITIAYRRGVGNDPNGEVETGWMEAETFRKYDDSTGVPWYQRPYNPTFTTSGSGITFNATTNVLTYTFCADKGNIPVSPVEASITQPGVPIFSGGVGAIEKRIELDNNVYEYPPVSQAIIDAIDFSVELPTDIPCDAAPTRTIVAYAVLYNAYGGSGSSGEYFPLQEQDNGIYVFGDGWNSVPPSDTDCTKSSPFKLGQVFADQVTPGFIAYLAGTPYKVIGKWGYYEIATGIFTPNNLPWPNLGPDIGKFPATGFVRCTQFEFVGVPAGKYIMRLASHHATINDANLQLTSTQVWGIVSWNTTQVLGAIPLAVTGDPEKELRIDCTAGNVNLGHATDLLFIILDLLWGGTSHSVAAIDGYLYESAGGAPVEMAVVAFQSYAFGTASPFSFGSYFTDHNGYYFATGTTNPGGLQVNLCVDMCDGSGYVSVFQQASNCGIVHNYGAGSGPPIPNYWGNQGSWAAQVYIAAAGAYPLPYPATARRVVNQLITLCSPSTLGVPGIPVVLTRGQATFTNSLGVATLIAHNRYNYVTVLTALGITLPYGASSLPDFSTSPLNREHLVFCQKGGCEWNACGSCNTSLSDEVIPYIGCGGSSSGCSGGGAMASWFLDTPGSGYIVGDTFDVSIGTTHPTGIITGVGTGGLVESFNILTYGQGCSVGLVGTSATSGAGSGLLIRILNTDPPPRTFCNSTIHVSANGVGIFGVQTGGKYPVGFILHDVINRHTSVQIKQGELGYVYIPNLNDTTSPYPAMALCQIKLVIPSSLNVGSNFTSITPCIGPNVLYENYLSWAADWVQFVDNTGTENTVNPTTIRVYYPSLNEYNKQYNYTTNTAWDFIDKATGQTLPGDIVQFIMNGDGNWLPSVTASQITYDKNGVFFTVPFIQELSSLTNGCLFKIIRPRQNKTSANMPYWEQCVPLPITNGILPAGTYILPYFDSFLLSRFLPVPIMAAVIDTNVPGTPSVVPVNNSLSQVGGGVQAISTNTLLSGSGALTSTYDIIGSQGVGIPPGGIPPYPLLYTSSNNSTNLVVNYSDLNNNTNGVVVFTTTDWPTTYPFFFEHHAPSDQWGSHVRNQGRTFFYNPRQEQYRVGTEIALSNPIADRGTINGIGTFLSENRQVFDRNAWGDITAVLIETSILLVICHKDHFLLRYGGSNVFVDPATGSVVSRNAQGIFQAPERKAGTNYGCLPAQINTIRSFMGIVRWLDVAGYVVIHNFSVADSNTDKAGYLAYLLQKIAAINIQNLDPRTPKPTIYPHAGIDPKTSEYLLTVFRVPGLRSPVVQPLYINVNSVPSPLENETFVFDLTTTRLKSFASFTPEYYGLMPSFYAQRQFFSFKGGVPYAHHANFLNNTISAPPPYANFYSTQCEARVTVVCNLDAEKVKRFFWIEVYCRASLLTGIVGVAPQPIMYADVIYTEKNQVSRLLPLRWSQRDGFWVAEFLCDLNSAFDPNLIPMTTTNRLLDGTPLEGRWCQVSLVTQSSYSGEYFEISNIIVYGNGVSKSDGT